MRFQLKYLWAVLPMILLVGCGPDGSRLATVPVTGKLLVDGKPYGGYLGFIPQMKKGGAQKVEEVRAASAKVADDGTFTVSTYEAGDGAVPGKYKAILSPDPMLMKPVPKTKPYTVTIPKEGPVELTIKLETAGGGKAALPGMM